MHCSGMLCLEFEHKQTDRLRFLLLTWRIIQCERCWMALVKFSNVCVAMQWVVGQRVFKDMRFHQCFHSLTVNCCWTLEVRHSQPWVYNVSLTCCHGLRLSTWSWWSSSNDSGNILFQHLPLASQLRTKNFDKHPHGLLLHAWQLEVRSKLDSISILS